MYVLSVTLAAALAAGTPQRVLLEFTDADATFSNESISITRGVELNEIFSSETDITAGLCPSAEIQFDLINDEGQFEEFAFGTFKAWLGARIDTGTPLASAKTKVFVENGVSRIYEFTPLGIFIADRPNVVKKKILSITANDQMTLFDVDMPLPEDMGLTYPTTIGTIYNKMCDYLNIEYRPANFLNYTLPVAEEPADFDGATMRDVLGWIAEAACCIARFSRDGVLEMVWFNSTNKVYNEQNYSEFTPAWFETAVIDGLNVRNANSEVSTVEGSDGNVYIIQNNPFLRAPDDA